MIYKSLCSCASDRCEHSTPAPRLELVPGLKKRKNKPLAEWQLEVDVASNKAYTLVGVERIGKVTYLDAICKVHGQFRALASLLRRGGQCAKCAKGYSHGTAFESFLAKAEKVHKGAYLYLSAGEGKRGAPARLVAVCRTHGIFSQSVSHHLNGTGCRDCSTDKNTKRMTYTYADWVAAVSARHGDRYRVLELLEGRPPTLRVQCSMHGEFTKVAAAIASGEGCKLCAIDAIRAALQDSPADVLARVKAVDPSKVVNSVYRSQLKHNFGRWMYSGVCEKHGEVTKDIKSYISKGGHFCQACGREAIGESSKLPWETAKQRCIDVHGPTYEYLGYVASDNSGLYISAICAKHGQFTQNLHTHLCGSGCPSCGVRVSRAQRDIYQHLTDAGLTVELEKQFAGSRKAFDICVEEEKLLIEYNGLHWHSERTGKFRNDHLEKTKLGNSMGYRVVQIMEDEWLYKQDIVKGLILSASGVSKVERISARCCTFMEIGTEQAREFLVKNHIQGFAPSTKYFGLLSEEVLIAVASFSMKERGRTGRRSHTSCELTRFATVGLIRGGFSKIVKNAQAVLGFSTLTTFSDNRLFSGKVYAAAGFRILSTSPPDYKYVNTNVAMERLHKRRFQLSAIRASDKLSYIEGQSEGEAMKQNGYYRIWDCGQTVWQKTW